MKSSTPMISVSVELLAFSFCLVELTIGKPWPKESPPPECPRMFGWTANDASTHHLRMPLPLALKISGIFLVPLMYFIRWTNLAQSSLSGSRTRVVRNAIAVHVSGLALLVAYRALATKLWNSTALSGLSFLVSSLTIKRLSGAALHFVPVHSGSALSKAARISST